MPIVAILLMGNAIAGANPQPVPVDDLCGILVPAGESKAMDMAVELLQTWMPRVYGESVKLPKVAWDDRPAQLQGLIILGQEPTKAAGRITDEQIRAASPGGHVVRAGDGLVVIAGPDSWSTLYGAVRFLEEVGVLFYLDGHHVDRNPIRKPETRNIGPFAISDKPVFPYRGAYEVIHKNCFNELARCMESAAPGDLDKGDNIWCEHTAGFLVPKNLYYDKHPEYYAMLESGERVKKTFKSYAAPLCLSNPDVLRISAERAVAWVGKDLEKKYFFIGYGDTPIQCHCEACKALDKLPLTKNHRGNTIHHAARHLHWINPVAEAIGKSYPDKIPIALAYLGADRPPPDGTKVAENLWIMGSTGLAAARFIDHGLTYNKRLAGTLAKIDGWLKFAPKRYLICEYMGHYEPALVDTTAGRLRFYASKGIQGVAFTYGSPTNWKELWHYLHAKLKWNPHQDAMALTKEFNDFYFGPSAGHVNRFFELSHERYVKTLREKAPITDSFQSRPVEYYSKAFVDDCLDALGKAVAAATHPGRVAKLKVETELFLDDALHNLPSYELTEANRDMQAALWQHWHDLVKNRKRSAVNDFIKTAKAYATKKEAEHPGYEAMISSMLEGWYSWLKKPELPTQIAEERTENDDDMTLELEDE